MPSQEEMIKAQEAENILNNASFKEAIANLKEEYVNHWLRSRNIDDVDMREDLHKAILLLPEIERHLRIIAEKGKITKSQLEKLRKIS